MPRATDAAPRTPSHAPSAAPALRNTLIATISTFLSHYLNTRFLQSGWLAGNSSAARFSGNPAAAHRRVLEMKTRFLYCMKVAITRLAQQDGPFSAQAAFREDVVTDRLEIVSTPERRFSDGLLCKCTEIMATDLSAVDLTDAICGQFLRYVLQMVRRDLSDPEHIRYLYLFCVWKMPEVLFEPSMGRIVRRREVQALLDDPRVPRELVEVLRSVRGRGVFPRTPSAERPVDEGWELEQAQAAAEPAPKRPAWWRLFARRQPAT